jgi:hypothetical protein
MQTNIEPLRKHEIPSRVAVAAGQGGLPKIVVTTPLPAGVEFAEPCFSIILFVFIRLFFTACRLPVPPSPVYLTKLKPAQWHAPASLVVQGEQKS